ncbi:hypothetical protein AVEN_178169-1 [Araneus ventricosus]|uniref:Retrotransposon gag domain-containing protein n=1 Tax=Araneus ventricosus TaxID=182803 RepID=A0A4Y2NS01_ARAVE|nr:hypothetical protein AVEN_149713-1 [Araneus ventricosus]GBN41160.1 hypothetical protein AVEN_81672-1 [Araneus ventricosus]GBO31445.1 hypothetical protein AVEN_142819-1 [Araneus ventricosus]GBO31448.1 hypothetical protein AVEN_178169-1 [Araneus ventricosus]
MDFVILSPPTTRRGTPYNPIMALNTGDQQTAFSIQIENFNGEPDKLEWFIQQITDLKQINKWSDEMTFLFLKSKLAGSALSWYASNPTCKNVTTFDDAVTQLRAFFRNDSTPLSNSAELHNIQLMPGESIRNLAHRIQVLTSRTYNLLEDAAALNQIQSIQLLNALPLKMKQKLIHEDTKNFSSLVEKAQKIVLTEQSLNLMHIASSPQMEESNSQNKILEELKNQIENLSNKVQNMQITYTHSSTTSDQGNDSAVQAYGINYTGQYFTPQNMSPQQGSIICSFYQKRNHTMSQCFQFKRHLRDINNSDNRNRNFQQGFPYRAGQDYRQQNMRCPQQNFRSTRPENNGFQHTFRPTYRPLNSARAPNTFRPHNYFGPSTSQNFRPQQNLNFRRGC